MSFKLRQLQVVQNKSLQVTGNYPKGTHISQLHDTLNVESIQDSIHRFMANFFAT
jgi:hypothetical protein